MNLSFFKKHIAAFILVATAFSFSACEREVLRGHGDDVTRTRTVGNFDEIEMGGEFEVYLTQGPAKDIVLEGQENVLADVRTTTRNNKLEIDFRSHRVKISEPVRVYITTPELTSLSISGVNKVRGLTDWHINDLALKSSGSGEIDLTLLGADNVETRISGSGEINLKGEAYSHNLEISGSGKLAAFDLYTARTEVNISGSGKSDVRVAESLQAKISGSGTVRYKGNPAVSTSVSGSGKIQKWD
ncbi:DUF2807 domain-containing protein [Adhaeribacter sp. BT258]|uniref:DUF2807 domain-containing protein n=1 Tax=Adhaeribacter terrigena TaxID=2793070 RepID=A0ABS1C3S1_9BACT|nr:head GIN domain-containing protein [Adhaeribacter terrigena]MBK0404009.1 DUF2807 domain-containing protein [Adhaeribacter terrigena]